MSAAVRWLKHRCGRRWPAAVKAADGAATTLLLTFVGYLSAHGVDSHHVGTADTWQAAAWAGLFAGLNVAKSAVMVAITGQTALGGLVSTQLRAQRNLRPVHHPVPLREPRPKAATRRVTHPDRAATKPARKQHTIPKPPPQ